MEEIRYFDGLGRPVQTVQVGASPKGNDIIQPILYDDFGRENIRTLPYTAEKSGNFRSGTTETIKNTVNTYYGSDPPEGIVADNQAFTQIGFDNSPLNRVTSQTGPGAAWETKPVKINYFSNSETKQGWRITGKLFLQFFLLCS